MALREVYFGTLKVYLKLQYGENLFVEHDLTAIMANVSYLLVNQVLFTVSVILAWRNVDAQLSPTEDMINTYLQLLIGYEIIKNTNI